MALRSVLATALALSPLLGSVAAHGNHSPEEIAAELALRDVVTVHGKRALDACSSSPAAQALKQRAIERRAAAAQQLREKRGLNGQKMHRKRTQDDLESWAAINHESSEGFTLDTPLDDIFGSNATCALVPESIIGPYYVEGELIRTDATDGQPGVPVHLDIQFVDVTSCAAVPQQLIDLWACNATGVYSGVAAAGQGGLNTTFGRAVQQTDDDGVVQFDTIFPGHYVGRTTHYHIMSTDGAEILPNGTFQNGTARNIGQLFFDQSIISEVETLAPYNTNTQALTTNLQDGIAADEATAEYDPFLKYVRLGDDLSDGLLMWITIGINTTANYNDDVTPAAHYYEGGGVDQSNGGGFPGGPGGPPFNGSAPVASGAGSA
ncbi:aromatic compound dioxygenase [Colletotrichum somersetense]|nr:aromatic compound dioxygenase [Colletotrichum somersetense]